MLPALAEPSEAPQTHDCVDSVEKPGITEEGAHEALKGSVAKRADQDSLLSIPGGRLGAVHASRDSVGEVTALPFSHSSDGVASSAGMGGAALDSWDDAVRAAGSALAAGGGCELLEASDGRSADAQRQGDGSEAGRAAMAASASAGSETLAQAVASSHEAAGLSTDIALTLPAPDVAVTLVLDQNPVDDNAKPLYDGPTELTLSASYRNDEGQPRWWLPTAAMLKRPGYVLSSWQGSEVVKHDKDANRYFIDCSALTEESCPGYATQVMATWSVSLNVTVPQRIVFGYDVAVDDLTAPQERDVYDDGDKVLFKNYSAADVRIVGLQCTRLYDEVFVTADAKRGDDAAARALKLLSMYPTSTPAAKQTVSFALDGTLGLADFRFKSGFTIPSAYSGGEEGKGYGELQTTYRLNLSGIVDGVENFAKVDASKNGLDRSIASIMYTIDLAENVGISGDDEPDAFYLKDGDAIYASESLKAIAEDLSENGEGSEWWEAAHRWLRDDVHAKLAWGDGITYDARIIGINHDDKSDGSGKAGLTFQLTSLLNKPYCMNFPTCGTTSHYNGASNNQGFEYYSWDSTGSNVSTSNPKGWTHNTRYGGWGMTLLRARMNPGTALDADLNAGSKGRDDDELWNRVPEALQRVIVPVDKRYYDGPGASATLRTASDHLFLASCSEMMPTGMASPGIHYANEGACYEWWASKGASASASGNPSLAYRQSLPGGGANAAAWRWWVRSVTSNETTEFHFIEATGMLSSGPRSYKGSTASCIFGIAPCFAL